MQRRSYCLNGNQQGLVAICPELPCLLCNPAEKYSLIPINPRNGKGLPSSHQTLQVISKGIRKKPYGDRGLNLQQNYTQ